ncbi:MULTISPECIES: phosphoribosylpyrophosphate synthetase [Christiangramia]|uniref:phosphoribosylpyrophosphate synthetase n=1 Tax=Christiangramia TaxID=292691 RepID=UPI001F3CE65C|nr:phosphoribosylpyrophosphate synthetase [Christiangramia flava]
MKTFDTLFQIINYLQEHGYAYDFNLCTGHIQCRALKLKLHTEDFDVDEIHRFEGMSNTDDSSSLYTISSKKELRDCYSHDDSCTGNEF